jgi:hypothetical protein
MQVVVGVVSQMWALLQVVLVVVERAWEVVVVVMVRLQPQTPAAEVVADQIILAMVGMVDLV